VELSIRKQPTDLGSPRDWQPREIRSFSTFVTKGATPTTYGFDWEEDGVVFLRSECVAEEGLDLAQSTFISRDAHAALRRGEVRSGDILMTITGYVGRVVRLPTGFGGANINQHIARIRVADPNVNASFVFHFLSQRRVRALYESITTGQAYPQISLQQVRETVIPLPPLPEQNAIARALDDVDSLLGELTVSLSKKRDLKQAAMQQLLTGRARLPGFAGEWQVRRLGSMAHIKTGARNNRDGAPSGTYPFFVRSDVVERIDSYSYDCEGILVPGEGRIGSVFHYIRGRFDVHQRVYAITQFLPNVSGRFVFYCMRQRFGAHALQNSVKATVDSLRLPTFQNFELTVPPTVEEQTAIVEVLSKMEAEIDALEARLEKTKALKQGMMQELLTGRTRLV